MVGIRPVWRWSRGAECYVVLSANASKSVRLFCFHFGWVWEHFSTCRSPLRKKACKRVTRSTWKWLPKPFQWLSGSNILKQYASLPFVNGQDSASSAMRCQVAFGRKRLRVEVKEEAPRDLLIWSDFGFGIFWYCFALVAAFLQVIIDSALAGTTTADECTWTLSDGVLQVPPKDAKMLGTAWCIEPTNGRYDMFG